MTDDPDGVSDEGQRLISDGGGGGDGLRGYQDSEFKHDPSGDDLRTNLFLTHHWSRSVI